MGLAVHQDKISEVERAFERVGYNQTKYADKLKISRGTLYSFLNGKSVSVEYFRTICKGLRLNWKEIANYEDSVTTPNISQHSEVSANNLSADCDPIESDFNDPKAWFPDSPLRPDSLLYIQRSGIESLCEETITSPGSLIRIKAPKLMGKTSLIFKILAHARKQEYNVAYINIGSVEKECLTGLERFLRWLCAKISHELEIDDQIDEEWNTKTLGSNDNCTNYFRKHFISRSNPPLVLALEGVDRLFAYPEWCEDFFLLLRSWHEKSQDSPAWTRLHLIISYSTEAYIPIDAQVSPFNIGVPVELPEFDAQAIQDLAKRRGIIWTTKQVQQLRDEIGGHPHLLQLATYYVGTGKISLEQLLKEASTEAGIYSHHLRSLLQTLHEAPLLTQSLEKVVNSSGWVALDSVPTFQLRRLGVLKLNENQVMPSCNLYRQYFCRVL